MHTESSLDSVLLSSGCSHWMCKCTTKPRKYWLCFFCLARSLWLEQHSCWFQDTFFNHFFRVLLPKNTTINQNSRWSNVVATVATTFGMTVLFAFILISGHLCFRFMGSWCSRVFRRYYRPNATDEGVDLLSEKDELQQRDEAAEPLLSTQTTQELKQFIILPPINFPYFPTIPNLFKNLIHWSRRLTNWNSRIKVSRPLDRSILRTLHCFPQRIPSFWVPRMAEISLFPLFSHVFLGAS